MVNITPQSDSHTLTVYKASAGSGKTFRLAIEYIKLLLRTPDAYKGILAVTFTNKATEEMKMRILSTLYGLWKQLSDSDDYMKQIIEETGLGKEEISLGSEKALRLLLHNYHYFKVQTIDTFFQSVLRNLARELQLSANLRVGLNTSEVIDEAVDDIIDQLADDKELRKVVMEYIEDSISDDKKWNIISNLKDFGNTIFTEVYKQHHDEMDEVFSKDDFFGKYKSEMYKIKKGTQEKYINLANEVLQKMQDAGLKAEDFANKTKGPISYFLKLAKGQFNDDESLLNKTVVAGMDDASKWFSKASGKKAEIEDFVNSVLMPFFSLYETQRKSDARKYNSAEKILAHLNDVRLLKKIEVSARNLNDASQRFMLSDTQSLLHEIIADDDSPFIFEKIGTYLRHVMIDEFQDTSKVQWANFKVLLNECMSQGLSNLIVGDVKQSIYRFRNGDWSLLNDIDKEFADGSLEFPPMKTNWRSSKNVIAFNNTFLNIIAQLEVNDVARLSQDWADSIKKAYDDVQQEIPDTANESGLVHIEMLPQSEKDNMQQHTLDTILDLINQGVEQRDIAILMRKAKDIPAMADYIEKESAANGVSVKIVSSEAFRLDASACVRIIVNAMKVLEHPDDKVSLAALVIDFQTTIHSIDNVNTTVFSKRNGLYEFLPQAFTEQRHALATLALSEMAEALVRVFSINENTSEGAYVTTFFDYIKKHCNEQMPTLEDFLEAWESDYCSKTIETSEVNGVRILTIHKSKGLQFKNVIIPNCNWNGNPPRQSILWTTHTESTFGDLPLIPVGYLNEKSLKGTIFEKDGNEEYIQNAMDNLNLLYVATTRAEDTLFIIGERDSKGYNRSQAICEAIGLLPETILDEAVHVENKKDTEKPLCVTYGHLPTNDDDETARQEALAKKQKKEEEKHKNVFTPKIDSVDVTVCSYPNNAEFRQSNESRRFADDAYDEKDNHRWIRLGTVMHQVFSSIKTLDDVEPKLRDMEFDGSLYDKELTHEEVIQSLRKKFDNQQVGEWFSDGWKVFNECNIITSEGEQRPDRVITNGKETIVIDFKFGKENTEHHDQVRRYIQLMQQMNMPDVKGYLWYVSLDKIVPVL